MRLGSELDRRLLWPESAVCISTQTGLTGADAPAADMLNLSDLNTE